MDEEGETFHAEQAGNRDVMRALQGGGRVDINGGGLGGGRQDGHRGSSGGSAVREAHVEVNWGRRGSGLHGVFSHL